MDQVLYDAVLAGQHAAAMSALRRGANPHSVQTADGDTAYAAASRSGNTSILRMILKDNLVVSTIHDLCRRNDVGGVTALLCSVPDAVHTIDQHGGTALHVGVECGRMEIVCLLLRHGARVNQPRGCDGKSALSIAVIHGWSDVVALLLQYGADWRQTDNQSVHALTHACVFDRARCVSLLLPAGKNDVEIPYLVGRTPLHCALDNQSMEASIALMEACSSSSLIIMMTTVDHVDMTAFERAVSTHNSAVIECVLKTCVRAGFNFNAPLRRASQFKGLVSVYPLESCILARCTASLLRCPRIDPNVRLGNGSTPLEYALCSRRIDAFEALLSHPDTCLWHPGTSLLHTIICTSTTEKPLRLLLKEITRRGQNTPGSERIDTLTHPRFITPLLLAIQDRHSNMALEILKTPAEFDIDNVSATGRTTLHAACDKGLSDVAIALIERGAVVSAVDCDGETPLYCACVKRMSDVAVRLLAHGADACAANLAGTTVLHAACTSNLPIVIVALLAHGANVFAADDRGVRPAFGMLDAQYGQVVANAHATQFMKRILCMVAALQRTKRRGLPIELWQLILSDYIELPFALKNIAVQRL